MKKYFLLLIVFFPLFSSCKVKTVIPENLMLIEKYFREEEYRKVIETLDNTKLAYNNPKDWYYFYYGVSLYKQDQSNSQQALEYLKIANAYNKKNYYITFYLGEVYYDLKRYNKAFESFEKCIKNEERYLRKINDNAIIWLLLSKLKMKSFDLEKFKQEYNICESLELERIVTILETGDITEEDIIFFIQSEQLNDREKLNIIDTLLEEKNDFKEFCESIILNKLPKLFDEYFKVRLIYYKLDDLDKCREFLKEINTFPNDSIFTISCNEFSEYLVWEYFLKYKMIYYWLTDDYYMVGSISQNYYYSEKRENVYEIKYSDDLSLFYKIFKNDKEFIEIKNKYKK